MRLRISHWNSRNAVRLVGHDPQVERIARDRGQHRQSNAGRDNANGDNPAARITVISRSPASR